MSACPADGRDSDVRLWVPLLNGMERLGVVGVTSPTPIAPARVPISWRRARCWPMSSSPVRTTATRSNRSADARRCGWRLRCYAPSCRPDVLHRHDHHQRHPRAQLRRRGDAFDYAINGDTAHLALFDAVGHGSSGGMRAVMLAGLALGAYRNARRAGQDLVGIYHHIDQTVRAHDRQGLITGILAELHQPTGRLRVISAGHPNGLIIRGGRVATVLPTPTALPVTMGTSARRWWWRRHWSPAITSCSTPTASPTPDPAGVSRSAPIG
ncbi:SpoIIE family protein phosphatase [Micromonospora sp. BRA006-A]|nr:SpoIIE family protein phosphatase [Micromonospora sp. BRA006-A]